MTVFRNTAAYDALAATNPGCDLILINRIVSRKLHADLTQCISANQKFKRAVVVLTTYGGDPHGGYRVARCLRNSYDHVRLLVPSFCKSAGTLIAIGANELAIGDLGELGPLDIQVLKPGEMLQRGSGLDATQALQQCLQHAQQAFVSAFTNARQGLKLAQKLAGEVSSSLAAGLLAPLYSQIDPLRLGEMQRAMAITLEYGTRLDGHSSNLKAGALNRLVVAYPAHEFVIDRKEARELFKKVSALSDSENLACQQLWGLIGIPAPDVTGEFGPAYLLPEVPPQTIPTPPAVQEGDHDGTADNGSTGAPRKSEGRTESDADAGAVAGAAAPASRKRARARSPNR
jgi:hypothetical protein